MYTASCAIALHFVLGTLSPSPAWQADYRVALQQAEAAKNKERQGVMEFNKFTSGECEGMCGV